MTGLQRNQSRRSMLAGLALGMPATMMTGVSLAADVEPATPEAFEDQLGIAAQVAAWDSEDLMATLAAETVRPTPMENFAQYVAIEITGDDLAEIQETFGEMVGVVVLAHEGADLDQMESTLGGYLVFASPDEARVAFDRASDETSTDAKMPLELAGLSGMTVLNDANADSLLQVGQVLILAGDAFLSDGARIHGADSVFRCIGHTVSLIDHLERITRPEADR